MVRQREVTGLLASWAMVAVGAAIAAALFMQALGGPAGFRPAGPVGSLQTVTLSNGQVYFGRLKSVDGGTIVLTGVFDAVTTTDPKTREPTTRLVSRQAADWHGPIDMAIPAGRIAFTETIGPGSAVGKAMTGSASAK